MPRTRPACLALLLAAGLTPPALAQAPAAGEEEAIIVTGVRERGYVSETQSGGTFGEQAILDTPFSVTVIPQQLLIDQQVRSLGDIVRNDPSAIVSSPPGFNDTVNIRGYNLDNSSSYRREGLIFQNQVQSPFENKAAVEIIKGPTSVRYGFTPPGGVINYVLKRPTAQPYRFAQAFGDSNGSYGVHLDLGGPLGPDFGVRLNAVASREASFVNDVAGPRMMVSGLVEWRPTDTLVIDAEVEYQYRNLEQQATISIASFAPSVTPEQRRQLLEDFDQSVFIGQRFGTYPTSNIIGSVGVRWQFARDWTLIGRAQQMRLERDQQAVNIQARSLQANGDFIGQSFFSPNQVRDPLSAELFVTGSFRTFGLRHEIAFGGAYSHNPLRFALEVATGVVGQSNIFNPVELPRPPASEFAVGEVLDALVFTQKALFFSDLVTVTDWLKLFGAVRYAEQRNQERSEPDFDRETTYQDDAFAPNVGILVQPTDKITVYGSYSEGVTTGVQVPSTADNFPAQLFLDPARTRQFEFGTKAEIFAGALLTAAYFDISQPLAGIDDDNIFGYIGDQDHKGVELTLAGQVTRDLRLVAGGLYLDPTIDNPANPAVDGNRPSGVPRFQANLYADYQLPMVPGLALNGGVFYTGERFADNQNTFAVDGYVRLDIGARYTFEFAGQRLTARVNVRNLTNADFIEGTAFGQFLFGSPRAAFFSLTSEF